MKVLTLEEQEDGSSECSDESEVEADEKEATSTPEEFSSSLFPKRSATIDMVEHLWKDFSVQDYTAVNNETLEAEQILQKMPKEKVQQGGKGEQMGR
jgi:hypothetical protein